jgi:hypothetical protein
MAATGSWRCGASALLALLCCALCLGALCLRATPAATAQPHALAYLDIPETTNDGAMPGGVNPALPLNRAELQSALDAARAAGIEPRRYAALLRQYWLVVGAENARIDLAAWDPQRGLQWNRATVNNVYVNYLRLNNTHPELYWTGLAGLAGVSFAAGFYDLHDISAIFSVPGIQQISATVADAIDQIPDHLVGGLPSDVRLLAFEGARITSADLDWYVNRLLIMQKHIFMDLIPMHEAYIGRGAEGIAEFARAGLLDENIALAWMGILSRTPAGLADATVRIASREQNQIIADQWDATARGRGDMSRVLTYATTVAGKPAVPGSLAPGKYAPIDTVLTSPAGAARVRAPLPDFNFADRGPRWDYIRNDLLPSYLRFLEQNPVDARALLATPFPLQAERGRLLFRLPDLLNDLSTGWQVEVLAGPQP